MSSNDNNQQKPPRQYMNSVHPTDGTASVNMDGLATYMQHMSNMVNLLHLYRAALPKDSDSFADLEQSFMKLREEGLNISFHLAMEIINAPIVDPATAPVVAKTTGIFTKRGITVNFNDETITLPAIDFVNLVEYMNAADNGIMDLGQQLVDAVPTTREYILENMEIMNTEKLAILEAFRTIDSISEEAETKGFESFIGININS